MYHHHYWNKAELLGTQNRHQETLTIPFFLLKQFKVYHINFSCESLLLVITQWVQTHQCNGKFFHLLLLIFPHTRMLQGVEFISTQHSLSATLGMQPKSLVRVTVINTQPCIPSYWWWIFFQKKHLENVLE